MKMEQTMPWSIPSWRQAQYFSTSAWGVMGYRHSMVMAPMTTSGVFVLQVARYSLVRLAGFAHPVQFQGRVVFSI